jgi:hypothetical protein
MMKRTVTIGPYAAANASVIAAGQVVAANGLFTLASTTMDTPRKLLITSSGNDTGVTFTITGTTFAQSITTETILGSSGGTVLTVTDWATITSVMVNAGTSTVSLGTSAATPGGSAWIKLDSWALASSFIQCVVSGTMNYTVQTTNDDPNSATAVNGTTIQSVVWDTTFPGIVGATASTVAQLQAVPEFIRILCNSYTAGAGNSVKMSVHQSGSVTY